MTNNVDRKSGVLVIMISLGNRSHYTDFTFTTTSRYCAKHGYDIILVKHASQSLQYSLERPPHFYKMIAHRAFPGYDRYLVIDDDFVIRPSAPELPELPEGKIGVVKDPIQHLTKAAHVEFTINTGFLYFTASASSLMEACYKQGIYTHQNENEKIWGPFDQAMFNNLVWKEPETVQQLDDAWNFCFFPVFYQTTSIGRIAEKSKVVRALFFASLKLPFTKYGKILRNQFGVHLIQTTKIKFISKILSEA